MNEEYLETVRHILQSNRSSFEHLAKQCQSHIKRIDNAIKKLDSIQKAEEENADLLTSYHVDERHQRMWNYLKHMEEKTNENLQN